MARFFGFVKPSESRIEGFKTFSREYALVPGTKGRESKPTGRWTAAVWDTTHRMTGYIRIPFRIWRKK